MQTSFKLLNDFELLYQMKVIVAFKDMARCLRTADNLLNCETWLTFPFPPSLFFDLFLININ